MLAADSALVTVGASLVLVTVSTYESLAEAPGVAPSSVHVTVIVCVPTSAFRGVPEIVPEAIPSVLGAPDIV